MRVTKREIHIYPDFKNSTDIFQKYSHFFENIFLVSGKFLLNFLKFSQSWAKNFTKFFKFSENFLWCFSRPFSKMNEKQQNFSELLKNFSLFSLECYRNIYTKNSRKRFFYKNSEYYLPNLANANYIKLLAIRRPETNYPPFRIATLYKKTRKSIDIQFFRYLPSLEWKLWEGAFAPEKNLVLWRVSPMDMFEGHSPIGKFFLILK